MKSRGTRLLPYTTPRVLSVEMCRDTSRSEKRGAAPYEIGAGHTKSETDYNDKLYYYQHISRGPSSMRSNL